MTKATITINGRTYDAITGMPVASSASQTAAAKLAPQAKQAPAQQQANRAFSDVAPARANHEVHAPARAVHRAPQKSQTLYRKPLTKPTDLTAKKEAPVAAHAQAAAPTQHHAEQQKAPERSPLISRYAHPAKAVAPAPQPKAAAPERIKPAAMHPTVARALQGQANLHAIKKPQLTGSDLKEQLIKERLAEVGDKPRNRDHKKTGWLSRQPRLVTVLSSTLALLILGGYLTYITLPSISLRVAASRAGVNANMPEYKPDGYSLDGPITYSPGEVVIAYKSNSNDETGYKLVQKATNWDSQAVLDNYVAKLTDNYLTFQERGVTVYTFGNKAAWVNGGLLYTIEGNAGLSSDQILRVATSL